LSRKPDANVGFVAGVEKFTLAVRGNGEDLTLVAGGDVESSVGRKREVPDVFCFWVEEN